jgi:hypothetical protein
LSSQRTSQTKSTTPIKILIPSASSRGSVVPQRPAMPQKSATSGLPPVKTASNKPPPPDPQSPVEAAKHQTGQYNRSGNPLFSGECFDLTDLCTASSGVIPSPVNTQPHPNLTQNPSISQPAPSPTTNSGPPPPPLNRPPYQPPPPPHVHNNNNNNNPPHPEFPGVVRQSPQLPPPTPTRDPRRSQQGGGWRYP